MQPIDTVESRAAVIEDTTASATATKILFVGSKVYLLKFKKSDRLCSMKCNELSIPPLMPTYAFNRYV
jgi:hypothetical protein